MLQDNGIIRIAPDQSKPRHPTWAANQKPRWERCDGRQHETNKMGVDGYQDPNGPKNLVNHGNVLRLFQLRMDEFTRIPILWVCRLSQRSNFRNIRHTLSNLCVIGPSNPFSTKRWVCVGRNGHTALQLSGLKKNHELEFSLPPIEVGWGRYSLLGPEVYLIIHLFDHPT